MPRTAFTKRFAPHTEGRRLQKQINQLEDDIDQLKGLSLSLEIGGVQVLLTSCAYEDGTYDIVNHPMPDEDVNTCMSVWFKLKAEELQRHLLSVEIKYSELTNP